MNISLLIIASLFAVASGTESPDLPANLRPEYVAYADSADYYIKAEMWADAKRCTIEALRSDPSNFNNALLFSNLGNINLQLDLPEEAISNFTTALAIAPASTTIRANRARVYMAQRDYENAQKDFEVLTEKDSEDYWAWKMLALAYLCTGREMEGYKALRRIPSPDADVLRLLAVDAVKRGEREQAHDYYDRMLEASPSEQSWVDHAWFLINDNDLDGAKEDIRQGMKQYPRSGQLVLLRAYIHKLLHENSLAEMDLKLAKEFGGFDESMERLLFPTSQKKR